ncbi:unnamed protein product [Penicillium nalgiovense]|uniref:Uncharacterized protein n=1 Tax=Penicillium nalgiovense TaxID=60175 RepID=A0A9W4H9R2_PENNA|nr:unnamed protein product [Penicillium nalgiovense]CAG7944074.1 unnamed protein product [Penicillium nalgiovense]CAG7951697.1 unnamed protein product [Penicillium nalgiovense]CAG7953950.1 unnamed protein product [Penicillium nalgiovense]CAG7954846.1 unnamed protein product [Penicillium nalgiovense]
MGYFRWFLWRFYSKGDGCMADSAWEIWDIRLVYEFIRGASVRAFLREFSVYGVIFLGISLLL